MEKESVLAIGIPAYKSVIDVKLGITLFGLGVSLAQDGMQSFITIADVCFVSHARNVLVHQSLKSGAQWLLMLDSDVYCYEPACLANMLFAANETNRKHGPSGKQCVVIAAPVRKRGGELNVERQDMGVLKIEDVQGKVRQVHAIGAACMAINLEWLRQHWPDSPWFTIEHPKSENGGEPIVKGEDYGFCFEVQKRGGLVLCDGRFMPGHAKGNVEEGFKEVP